jgi:hypothetical protein
VPAVLVKKTNDSSASIPQHYLHDDADRTGARLHGRGVRRALGAIIGSVQNEPDPATTRHQYDAKNKRLFYHHLYNRYNVVEHFTVSGEVYWRQGAGWPVDVIVIEGRGRSSRRYPAAQAPQYFVNFRNTSAICAATPTPGRDRTSTATTSG